MIRRGRRGTFLVLLGAGLAAVTLTVGVVTQGAMPVAASAPEPVAPISTTPVGDTPSREPTSTLPTPPDSSATPTTSSSPTPSATSRPMSTPSAPPEEPAFRAIAGPACPVTDSRSVQVSPGWQVVPGNSWTGDGCGNRFLYSAPDDPNYVQWRFAFDTPAERDFRITVFVPDSPLAKAQVWYGVADRFENASYRVGGFTVDQEAGRGRWVNAGNISVGTGALLINVNGAQGLTGVTAGPVRVACWVTGP